MKTLPLIIFSILSLFGVVSYTIPSTSIKSIQLQDPVSIFINKPGTAVLQFNSTWNKQNEYKWKPVNGVRYLEVDIDNHMHYKSKYKLHSLPTIIIYKNGKEVTRYEANLMMKLDIKQQDLQHILK